MVQRLGLIWVVLQELVFDVLSMVLQKFCQGAKKITFRLNLVRAECPAATALQG
jgi:hypothetical protein